MGNLDFDISLIEKRLRVPRRGSFLLPRTPSPLHFRWTYLVSLILGPSAKTMSATMSRAQVPRSTSQSMHYPRSPVHEERRASDGYHSHQRSNHLRHPGSPPGRVPSHSPAWPVIPPDSPSSPGRVKHPKYRSENFVIAAAHVKPC